MNKIASFGAAIPAGVLPGTRIPALAPDEDALTLVVEAASRALAGLAERLVPDGVVVVSVTPPFLEGDTDMILLRSLRLPTTCRVRQVVGGGPALLEAIADASAGLDPVLVVGVHTPTTPGDGAAAGAALLAPEGRMAPGKFARSRRAMPIRVRTVGKPEASAYDDQRLVRDLAGRPAVADVLDECGAGDERVVFVGLPSGAAGKPAAGATVALGYLGAAGPLLELQALGAEPVGTSATLVAADGASAAALRVTVEAPGPGLSLPAHPVEHNPADASVSVGFDMPVSLAAYARAFDAKVGFAGARCAGCGTVNFPPRSHCLSCRGTGPFEVVDLPRRGLVYTATTVNVPVPGLPARYGLAVVEVQPGVRVLVRMTQDDLNIGIGDEVELVLRKLADREGIPDYAYAARPALTEERSI